MSTEPKAQTTEAEREGLLAICEAAGIPPEAIIDHPEHGLMVAAHPAHKLRALAPPSQANDEIGKMITDATRSAIRRVK